MSNKKIITALKKYQRTSRNAEAKRDYFDLFEKKMLYRTTKSENPRTTMGMVNKVLNKTAN